MSILDIVHFIGVIGLFLVVIVYFINLHNLNTRYTSIFDFSCLKSRVEILENRLDKLDKLDKTDSKYFSEYYETHKQDQQKYVYITDIITIKQSPLFNPTHFKLIYHEQLHNATSSIAFKIRNDIKDEVKAYLIKRIANCEPTDRYCECFECIIPYTTAGMDSQEYYECYVIFNFIDKTIQIEKKAED